jgi:uncharacterized membrane protein SpoIIM required for sporulation
MKVAELLETRRRNWQQLEQLCAQMEGRTKRALGAGAVSRFAALYRAACADLALADAYQLPPNTVTYLHQLVGRAHNQLYRSRMFSLAMWAHMLLVEAPQRIFNDRCVQLMFGLFWFVFIASAFLAASPMVFPHYAEGIMGREYLTMMEEMYSQKIDGRSPEESYAMASFYIYNNTGIGLKCFVLGLLVIPGLYITVFNAALLGAAFGHMARPDVPQGVNFYNFVTAHGPFELTAIVLSAGSGLRLGMSLVITHGLTRLASLRKTAVEAMPLMGAAMILFFLAAMIEGFLSPSGAPYALKAGVAIVSSGLLMFYFVILGYPRRGSGAIG